METYQKTLLTLGVAGLAMGIVVFLIHAELAPAWTIALPAGVVCLGLFLLSLLWRRELARLDEEERLKVASIRGDPSRLVGRAREKGQPLPKHATLAAAHSD